jgi:hypothetical protein
VLTRPAAATADPRTEAQLISLDSAGIRGAHPAVVEAQKIWPLSLFRGRLRGVLTRRTPFPAYGSCCLKSGIEREGNGVRSTRLWARLLGLVRVVVEGVEFDEDEQAVVVSVRPRKATKRRCGRCGRLFCSLGRVFTDAPKVASPHISRLSSPPRVS